MINYKMPKLVKLYAVKDGNIQYVCSCSRLASIPIKDFNKNSRCLLCTKANDALPDTSIITESQSKELFIALINNGLYEFINRIESK